MVLLVICTYDLCSTQQVTAVTHARTPGKTHTYIHTRQSNVIVQLAQNNQSIKQSISHSVSQSIINDHTENKKSKLREKKNRYQIFECTVVSLVLFFVSWLDYTYMFGQLVEIPSHPIPSHPIDMYNQLRRRITNKTKIKSKSMTTII